MEVLPISLYEYLLLFLLCFISFLIGWFFGRNKKTTEVHGITKDELPETAISTSVQKTVLAVQTRRRGGQAVTEDVSAQTEAGEQSVGLFSEIVIPEKRDNLKKINGIGPTIEEKLNDMGIYTFLQISSFSPKDVEQVAKSIESFPKKIEKEKWIQQAKEFLHTQSHQHK